MDDYEEYLIEAFVEKEDFGKEVITTDKITEQKKVEHLISSLTNSLKRIQQYKDLVAEDIEFYTKYFHTSDLETVLRDSERIRDAILKSIFYPNFMRESGELIQTSFITGKVIPANREYIIKNYSTIDEYYQNMGIRFDFSEEQKDYKDELLRYVGRSKPDKDKIKTLLQDKNYI